MRQEEANRLIDIDKVTKEAIDRAEQSGIVFVDEIDKIASRGYAHGPDVSREGVQRDLLPIVEGTTVTTKHGPVKTEHILFIAAGAFHMTKPSDLIPELQGRFPIRVELEPLGKEEFIRILTEPYNALIKQYIALTGYRRCVYRLYKGFDRRDCRYSSTRERKDGEYRRKKIAYGSRKAPRRYII